MTKLIIAMVLTLTSTFANAQQQGSGKMITKTYDYQNFDKVSFSGFNDNIEIEIGKAYNVEITLKEENEKFILFAFDKNEKELSIKVKPQAGKQLYETRASFKIKVTMPEISVLQNTGNSDVVVNGITGKYFSAKTTGNGDLICSGSIDSFDVEKTGNGDIKANRLIAKSAKIKSSGNGDVIVSVSEKITAQNIGNGDVKNIGKARFDSASKTIGNGDLLTN